MAGLPPSSLLNAPWATAPVTVDWVAPRHAHRLRRDWERLAAEAAEPNPFFEPFALLAAFDHLGSLGDTALLTIREGARLIGLLPVERRPRVPGLPWAALRTFRHRHCYLGAPLVAADRTGAALGKILDEVQRTAGGDGTLDLPLMPADGPLASAFRAAVAAAGRPVFEMGRFERAFYRAGAEPSPSAETDRRLRQLSRRLATLGDVSFVTDDRADSPLVSAFYELEVRGWKGRAGTAIAQSAGDQAYFGDLLAGAAAQGRLVVQALCAAGRPVAVNVNLRVGDGIVALKTAFDERHGKCSPGFLAEHQTLRWLAGDGRTAWLDTCAAPDQSMVNRTYRGRRAFGQVLVGPSGLAGRTLARLWPIAREVRRHFTR